MQSIDMTSRLTEAIGSCTELRKDLLGDVDIAKQNAVIAKEAYEAAETFAKHVETKAAEDLVLVRERQSLLGRLIGQDDAVQVGAALAPISLSVGVMPLIKRETSAPPSPPPSAAKTTKKQGKARLSAPSFKIISAKYDNDPGYLDVCSIIVPDPGTAGQYVELRCMVCDTNVDPARKSYMKGACGVQKHMQKRHGLQVPVGEALQRSVYRTWTSAEVEKLVTGEYVAGAVISGRSVVAAPPKAAGPSKRKRAKRATAVEEDDEESEGNSADLPPIVRDHLLTEPEAQEMVGRAVTRYRTLKDFPE